MIRWYDYIVAFVFADLLLTAALTIPFIGVVISYAAYEYGWEGYCEYRKKVEKK